MIRSVELSDAESIAGIYNYYVANTDISFEVEPVSKQEMVERIQDVSSRYPFLVYENGDGELLGFCYAHQWKERAAYKYAVETTVYCSHRHLKMGIGQLLMQKLIDECRNNGYVAMIACITGDNRTSIRFHEELGFKRVSYFEKVGFKFGRFIDVVDYELLL